MIYYANPTGSELVHAAMNERKIGCIVTPKQGNRIDWSWEVIADNGCFSSKWNATEWWAWLTKVPSSVRFAVCPDVFEPGGTDLHERTMQRWNEWAPRMKDLGLDVAFVCQDGATPSTVPTDADALFLGGTNDFKLSSTAEQIIRQWSDHKWCHMGRVNSMKRLRIARDFGCHSADGTHLVFCPDTNLRHLTAWLKDLNERPSLFTDVAAQVIA